MQQAVAEFSRRATQIAVVTFQDGPIVRAYADELCVPWPILIDRGRQLYLACGMMKVRFMDMWDRAMWGGYAREVLHGQWPRWPRADPAQQGGDVLVDPNGVVRLHHVGRGPADRPSLETLLAAYIS